MTEDEIKKELNKQMSDHYHIQRTKNFQKNISDSQSRSRQIQQLNKIANAITKLEKKSKIRN